MVTEIRSPLEQFLQREARHPDKRYLVQPLPGGQVQSLTWGEAGDQARRAAAWLRSLQLPPGSRVAIISKNCAHWIIADVAIWMAGHVSVPLYPNLTAESARQMLSHSEAAVAFVGKLDDWPAMAPGLPAEVLSVSLPLHPAGRFDHSWDDLQACEPLQEVPLPDPASLATIIYTSGTTGTPKGVMHSYANFDFAASHKYEIAVAGSTITTSVDGSVLDKRSDATFAAPGIVGFRTSGTERGLVKQVQVTSADGTVLVVKASGEPMRDEAGRFIGWWGVSRNVTAEVQAQRELQRSREMLERLFRESPDAIFVASTPLPPWAVSGPTELGVPHSQSPPIVKPSGQVSKADVK